ncbi:hypothetical protein GGX14DRAFT_395346 [Mycena pura]|uniref:Uncharacterized protein n=1 Tax=Mycena pura TaxID=153505 RepID=A0AAD6VER7_9AGAR|nr:hypothetical protein GGX14DRAFT_395346 [Mycena pura]
MPPCSELKPRPGRAGTEVTNYILAPNANSSASLMFSLPLVVLSAATTAPTQGQHSVPQHAGSSTTVDTVWRGGRGTRVVRNGPSEHAAAAAAAVERANDARRDDADEAEDEVDWRRIKSDQGRKGRSMKFEAAGDERQTKIQKKIETDKEMASDAVPALRTKRMDARYSCAEDCRPPWPAWTFPPPKLGWGGRGCIENSGVLGAGGTIWDCIGKKETVVEDNLNGGEGEALECNDSEREDSEATGMAA